jgi:hypothetical protein
MIIGYPTETELDHQENIKALYKYQKYVYSNTIFMISLGFTMHLIHGTPIMNILEDLEIEDYSAANIFKWNIGDNTLKNRILRRLEIHETAVKLGYKIPRSYSNLKVLEDLSLQVN